MKKFYSRFIQFAKNVFYLISPKYHVVFLDFFYHRNPYYTFEKPHQKLYELINSNRHFYLAQLQQFKNYVDYFKTISLNENSSQATLPHWKNKYFPGLDMMMLHHFVTILKPNTIIEIGSGTSTKVIKEAIRQNKQLTTLISIDPSPRSAIDNLCDQIIRKPLEEINDLTIFMKLQENDIVFFDGSHRALTHSDVSFFFLDILPILKKGVVVHFHDIYLPYDYPELMIDRAYSEQFLLATYLLNTIQRTEILMPNFFVSCDRQLSESLQDLWLKLNPNIEKHGGSFWIRV